MYFLRLKLLISDPDLLEATDFFANSVIAIAQHVSGHFADVRSVLTDDLGESRSWHSDHFGIKLKFVSLEMMQRV